MDFLTEMKEIEKIIDNSLTEANIAAIYKGLSNNFMETSKISKQNGEIFVDFQKSMKKLAKLVRFINNKKLNKEFAEYDKLFGEAYNRLTNSTFQFSKNLKGVINDVMKNLGESQLSEVNLKLLWNDLKTVLKILGGIALVGTYAFVTAGLPTVIRIPITATVLTMYTVMKDRWIRLVDNYRSFYSKKMVKYTKYVEESINLLKDVPSIDKKDIILLENQLKDMKTDVAKITDVLGKIHKFMIHIVKNKRKYLKGEEV